MHKVYEIEIGVRFYFFASKFWIFFPPLAFSWYTNSIQCFCLLNAAERKLLPRLNSLLEVRNHGKNTSWNIVEEHVENKHLETISKPSQKYFPWNQIFHARRPVFHRYYSADFFHWYFIGKVKFLLEVLSPKSTVHIDIWGILR